MADQLDAVTAVTNIMTNTEGYLNATNPVDQIDNIAQGSALAAELLLSSNAPAIN